MLVKFLRNPQFCAIGNIFYFLEPFCSLELYEETVQLATEELIHFRSFFASHFSYEFSLDFHIFQGSLYTSKGKRESRNRVFLHTGNFSVYCRCASADLGLNPRIAENKKAPCFTSPLIVGALLSRDGLGYRGTTPALVAPDASSCIRPYHPQTVYCAPHGMLPYDHRSIPGETV